MPAIVIAAFLNLLKPSITAMRCFTPRWSCSIRLFRYFDERSFVFLAGRGSGNSRNGHSSKTVLGDDGAIELAIPRDRNGSFEPQNVAKGQTRLDGFDDRIISLYAPGLSVREIQAHLQELHGVEASPDLISRVTD